jgi:hypothetical protein
MDARREALEALDKIYREIVRFQKLRGDGHQEADIAYRIALMNCSGAVMAARDDLTRSWNLPIGWPDPLAAFQDDATAAIQRICAAP